MGVKAAGA